APVLPTLSLHDALPILAIRRLGRGWHTRREDGGQRRAQQIPGQPSPSRTALAPPERTGHRFLLFLAPRVCHDGRATLQRALPEPTSSPCRERPHPQGTQAWLAPFTAGIESSSSL